MGSRPKSSFWKLLLFMLITTRFFGLNFLTNYFPEQKYLILPLGLLALVIAINNRYYSLYGKWLLLLAFCLVCNCLSAHFIRGASFSLAFGGASSTAGLLMFFLIQAIHPTVQDVEKVLKYMGIMALCVYFLQLICLPVPIVESISSGWRVESAIKMDINKFSISAEVCAVLLMLWCINRILERFSIKYMIISLMVIVMYIFHGYRSLLFGLVVSVISVFILFNRGKLKIKYFFFFSIIAVVVYLVLQMPFLQDMLSFMIDRSADQVSGRIEEVDRVIELNYFFNDYLLGPWEWIFGSGFIGKVEGSWVNWVDLGFIGYSFVGGLMMTFCWLKLLVICIRDTPKEYAYLSAFSIYLIASTLTLPTAFNEQAPVIQALCFYLAYMVKTRNKQTEQKLVTI